MLLIGLYEIQKSIESILVHSQNYPFQLNAKALTEQWYDAKRDIIKAFDGKLVIRSKDKILVHLSEEQKSKEFHNFIDMLDENEVMTDEFENFLTLNKAGLFENKVVWPNPDRRINVGMRLSKAIKKFIPEEENIKWIQSAISRLVQANKAEGHLYLSVDPRDFLLLSENNANWWTCQSLDGDFRAGNLNYMVDTTTVVAYLANESQEHLKCIPESMTWYSKKWRMLVHIDPDRCLYFNRQYPFYSKELETQIYNFLSKVFNLKFTPLQSNCFRKVNNITMDTNQMYVGTRVFDTRDIFLIGNYLGFCDLIESPLYLPISAVDLQKYQNHIEKTYSTTKEEEEEKSFHNLYDLQIGNCAPICPCCGDSILDRGNSYLCHSCRIDYDADVDLYLLCDCCGRRFYDNDEVFWAEDKPYCKKCFHSMKADFELQEIIRHG